MKVSEIVSKYLGTPRKKSFFLIIVVAVFLLSSGMTDFSLPLIIRVAAIFILLLSFIKFEAELPYENVIRLLSIIFILFTNQISEGMVLRKEIAYKYVGQDAGTYELYLYQDYTYKIAHGGILGATNKFYGKYVITNDMVQIDKSGLLQELEGQEIEINGIQYEISD